MSSIYDNYPALKYVDEVERDNSEECKRCKGNCGYIGMIGEWACHGFVPKEAKGDADGQLQGSSN